jgi:hypothetical protein
MNVVNINGKKGAPKIILEVIDELLAAKDNVENIIITYTIKDDGKIYSAWSGERLLMLLGLVRCTEDDILNSMRE